MVWAAYMSLPLSLEEPAPFLLEKQKLAEGKDLIKYLPALCANEAQRSAHK